LLGTKNKENKVQMIEDNESGISWLLRTLQFIKSINSPVPHLYGARAGHSLWYSFSIPLVLTFLICSLITQQWNVWGLVQSTEL
jgi:hypothetical protein